jgi:adenylylsulfate kinase-like enzyme
LSGSGKTTIGDLLFQRLHAVDDAVVLLDGDALRREAKEEFGYSPEERRRAAFHYSNLARTNAARGTHVVVATISMYADCRLWNRRHLPRYYEIYLRVPLDVLIGRDAGNLYSRAIAGKVSSVVGVDLPFEEPESADLIIDNHGSVAADQAADDIWERIKVLPGVLNEPG